MEWYNYFNFIKANLIILFLGVGKAPPTFIYRRLECLANYNVAVLSESEITSIKDYQQLAAGSLAVFNPKSLISLIPVLLSVITRPGRLLNLIKIFRVTVPNNSIKNRLYLSLRYHRLLEHKINILHFQWIGHVYQFKWLIELLNIPVVASARGSMVTIYPVVRQGYLAGLNKSFQLSDAIHCVSEDIKSTCIRLGAGPNKCFVNYNGIDTEKFKPGHRKESHYVRTISVGALMWRKGVNWQLMIIRDLLARGIPVRHIIVGDGLDREGLLYQAEKLGVKQQVNFIGQLNETEVIKYLQNTDVYLSTSAAEGLANSVLEAAACGLPVVAFDCEGMKEIILHNKTGYVVEYGDLAGFADKVEELADDPSKRWDFGKQARALVEQQFRIEDQVKKMVRKYRELIDDK